MFKHSRAALAALFIAALATTSLVGPADAQFEQQSTFGGTSGGTASTQTVTIPNVGQLSDLRGVTISFIVGTGLTNTGAVNLQLSGLSGAPPAIYRMNSGNLVPLAGGEMPAGKMVQMTYDGTEFILLTNYATGVPTGQVAYFDSASCPAGWEAANGSNSTVDARGVFLRALDSGKGIDTGRTLASTQADGVGPVGWSGTAAVTSYNGPFAGNNMFPGSSWNYYQPASGGNSGSNVMVQPNSSTVSMTPSDFNLSVSGSVTGTGTETRPKNVALLACQAL